MNKSPILIIGKSGKTGWRVEQRLQQLGYQTRGVSRSTTPAFDWLDQSSWPAALDGVKQAYVTFHPDLAIPTAEQTIRDLVKLAKDMALEHMVLLSGRGEAGARRAELVLEQSGLEWNVVRANWFMQNFSEAFMIEGILNGELMLPAGAIKEPFIDVDDIADVAVATLTRPELRNRIFAVSGPRALTFAECAREISEVTGYPVNYRQISFEAFHDALKQQGADDDLLWLMRELFTVVFDGRNSEITHGVEQALGRPATDFQEYLKKVTASGAWDRTGMQASA